MTGSGSSSRHQDSHTFEEGPLVEFGSGTTIVAAVATAVEVAVEFGNEMPLAAVAVVDEQGAAFCQR